MHAERRKRFFEAMEDGLAIFPSAGVVFRNHDTEHRFRQESAFYYLTGFEEPDAVAVLVRAGRARRLILFVQPRDPATELWIGARAGVTGARRDFGARESYPLSEFPRRIEELLDGRPRLYMELGGGWRLEGAVLEALTRLKRKKRQPGHLPRQVLDPRELLAELRLLKQEPEIEELRRAATVTERAFREMLSQVRPGVYEYQLRAVFEAVCGLHGAERAFETIVAAGDNACTLHYVDCVNRLEEGQLLLLDAGAELNYYCSDVTRTVPANGAFSPAQLKVYQIVLAAQRAAVEAAGPGARFYDVHDAAAAEIVKGLQKLGLLKGKARNLVERQAYKPWFPHGTSHWLGLDAHDAGSYALDEGPRILEPGMVITVEPGLYLNRGDRRVPRRYRGIGIRIEDDVLVTENGCEVLTEAVPREPREIERALRARPRYFRPLGEPEPRRRNAPDRRSARTGGRSEKA